MNIVRFIQQIELQRKEQDSLYHSVAVKFGLSDTAMWILYLVSETEDDLTQQDLCKQSFYAKQTINTAITSLVKNGFVELISIPGTRNHKKVHLTDAGRELVKGTTSRLKIAEQNAYGKLTEEELQAYLDITSRLTGYLREETEKLIGEEI